MQAVILAGGLGKRLRPITDEVPKVMIEVAGKRIIHWQIEWLKTFGITSFIVLAGYKRDRLIEFLGNGSTLGVKVYYSVEEEPLGTGGALKAVEGIVRGNFLVLNGDIITDIDISKMSLNNPHIVNIALVPLRSPYGVIRTEGDEVRGFEEKPILRDYWINGGVYLMSEDVFKYLPEKGDIERTTFPDLARIGKVRGTKFPNNYWHSIDSVKDMEEVSSDIANGKVFNGLVDTRTVMERI